MNGIDSTQQQQAPQQGTSSAVQPGQSLPNGINGLPNGSSALGNQASSTSGTDEAGANSVAKPSNGFAGSTVASTSTARGPQKIYKRQRIEYEPVRKPLLHPGTWDPEQIEELLAQTASKRPRRGLRDLGIVDTRTLMMSLRSRIGPEVAYALNTLAILSSTPPQEFIFHLSSSADLADELLELFEDVVQGSDDGDDLNDQEATAHGQQQGQQQNQAPTRNQPRKDEERVDTYIDDQKTFYEEEYCLKPISSSSKAQRFAGLNRSELALTCTAILRNFTQYDQNIIVLVKDSRLLKSSLLLVLTESQKSDLQIGRAPSDPVRLNKAQLLQARKDVLQIIGNLGYQVQLENLPKWMSQAAIQLISYFLGPNDVSNLPQAAERPSAVHAFGAGLDTALLVLSRIALSDANRDALSKLPPTTIRPFILSKFQILVDLFPMTDTDFQYLAAEPPLLRMELVAMCMYNLVYIAAVDIRKKLREQVGTLKVLTRVIKRLYQANLAIQNQQASPSSSRYMVLCLRCIEILRVLTEDEVGSNNGGSSTGNQEGVAWFGGYRDAGDEGQGGRGGLRSRPSLLFARAEFIELMSLPVYDKALFAALAECT